MPSIAFLHLVTSDNVSAKKEVSEKRDSPAYENLLLTLSSVRTLTYEF